jgi:hypothetical protein
MYHHFDPRLGGGESKCTTISTSGCGGSPLGARAANSSAGTWGRKSQCERFAATVCAKLEAGLSAQRIYQDGGERVFGLLPVGETVCGQAQGEPAGAGVANGVPAWRGDAGGFRPGSADRGTRRQDAPELGVACGAKLFAQGLQRGGNAAGYRDVPALPGERGSPFRGHPALAQLGQPQGGGSQGRLA